MAEAQDYRVKSVEPRDKYTTDYGEFQAYALQLDGVEGYVQLSQKPETEAPVEGQKLHGYTYSQKSAKGDFLKFKKVNPNWDGGSKPQSNNQASAVDINYHTQLLEAIAINVGATDAVRSKSNGDVAADEIEDDPIDLSEIPF